jgi:hypothetical protein
LLGSGRERKRKKKKKKKLPIFVLKMMGAFGVIG